MNEWGWATSQLSASLQDLVYSSPSFCCWWSWQAQRWRTTNPGTAVDRLFTPRAAVTPRPLQEGDSRVITTGMPISIPERSRRKPTMSPTPETTLTRPAKTGRWKRLGPDRPTRTRASRRVTPTTTSDLNAGNAVATPVPIREADAQTSRTEQAGGILEIKTATTGVATMMTSTTTTTAGAESRSRQLREDRLRGSHLRRCRLPKSSPRRNLPGSFRDRLSRSHHRWT